MIGGSTGGEIVFWDLKTLEELKGKLKCLKQEILKLFSYEKGRILIVGYEDS